jgi:hypothetical protein
VESHGTLIMYLYFRYILIGLVILDSSVSATFECT